MPNNRHLLKTLGFILNILCNVKNISLIMMLNILESHFIIFC